MKFKIGQNVKVNSILELESTMAATVVGVSSILATGGYVYILELDKEVEVPVYVCGENFQVKKLHQRFVTVQESLLEGV